jgi:pilus assembly protein Flp/PilA
MHKLIVVARQWLAKDDGASIVEYATLLALIALICVAAMTLIGTAISSVFATLAGSM